VNGSRERDQAVEQLLRQSLSRSGSAADACLDAETLAAWADGGLSGGALEMAQSHVADCARCQAMAGALARIDSRIPQVGPERAARPWLAWLVPLTAATAAIAIWVAVPRNPSAPVAPSSVQQPEAQSKSPPAPPLSEPLTQPRRESKGALSEPRPELRVGSKGAPLRERDQAQTPASDQKKDMSGAPAAGLRKESVQLESERTRSAAGRSVVPAPASAPAAAAPPALADRAAGLTRSAERAAQSAATEIAAPDSSVRWRIAASGLERSIDNGLLWEAVPTNIAAELTAVAAPSASVCWAVGRGGVVLLWTDGRSWRRVPFPETTDLSAVQARDARSASVSTADGRTFSTTDGGVTWVRRPLQEF
jgi:hypothetical protein